MKYDQLRSVSAFRDLNEGILRRLASACRFTTFDAGARILDQQEDTLEVVFLLSGHARVNVYSLSGIRVSFREIKAGAMFGELSAIDELPRSASVEAITDCSVAVMPRHTFLSLLRDEPTFAMSVMIHLTTVVRSLTERVFEFSTLAVRNRIHAELLRLAAPIGEQTEAVIEPAPTHEEIASRISTHREAVGREFNRLEHLNLLSKHGRRLKINDIGQLRRLVDDGLLD